MENKKSVVFISVPYSKNPSRGEELSYYAGLFVRSLDKIPFSPVFTLKIIMITGANTTPF
jgi:hypothetical protein